MALSETSVKKSPFLLFILRNAVLYILLFNAYLHFAGHLNLLFASTVFLVALGLALFMHLLRLRLPVCLLLFVLLVLASRGLSFLSFRLGTPAGSVSDADFLFFQFDKDFFPALVPAGLAWLFNLLALRYRRFITIEAGLNALLMLVVFSTEANYNIKLYHPTLFALVVMLFILLEVAVLMLHWLHSNPAGGRRRFSPIYFLVLIPLLLVFFINYLLMQKYDAESVKNRGGLMESTLFRFDFSKYIKLESEISLNDDLVMLLRKNGPASRILIRRFVLSAYEPGRGFHQSEKYDDIPAIVPDSPLALPDPGYAAREAVEQEYFFVNLDPTSLVAMNYPVTILPLKNWDASSFLRIYRVVSQVSQLPPEELEQAQAPELPPAATRFYTEYADDEEVQLLAEEVTLGIEDYTEKVLAIRDYLRENYYYSLKPGLAADGNQLHHFLFESHKGYCSYFAFAMALMCRSLGIPARVAVGFAAAPGWEVLNFYEIRANLAHAWVEVYFGDYGWIEFDPTSSNVAPGEDLQFLTEFNVSDELKDLISEILDNQNDLQVEDAGQGQSPLKNGPSLQELLQGFNSFIARTWYFLLPALYTLLLLMIKLRAYLRFLLAAGRRQRAKQLFLHSLMPLYNLGRLRQRGESWQEYAARLEATWQLPFRAWTDSYLKAVFAEEFSAADYTAHLALYRNFLNSWRKQVPLPLRGLAFLNPLNSLRRKDF